MSLVTVLKRILRHIFWPRMEKYHVLALAPGYVPAPLTTTDKMWKASSFVIAIFFLFAAAVQYNDPDPYLWMPVYLIPAIMSLCIALLPMRILIASSRWMTAIATAYILCCFVGGAVLIGFSQGLVGESGNPLDVEEGRELCGLLITTLWSFLTILLLDRKLHSTFVHEALSNRCLAVMATGAVVFALIPPLLWSACFIERVAGHLSYCAKMHQCGVPLGQQLSRNNVSFT